MKAWQASDRWSCDHHAPNECPWCANPDGEVWRDVSSYAPIYGLPAVAAPVEPTPALSLAEYIDKINPGFFERGAGGAA